MISVLATTTRNLHAGTLSIPGWMCCIQAQSFARRLDCYHKPKNVQKSALNKNYWYRSMRELLANKHRFYPDTVQQELVHDGDRGRLQIKVQRQDVFESLALTHLTTQGRLKRRLKILLAREY
ncbi:MAG TPA: hypothetical protein V6C50_07705 [Crinalium sp.]